MEIIYVLWLRQVKKYFRSPSRIVGSLAQPLLYLVAFGYGLGSVFSKAGQGNYISFLVPGIISMSVLFTSIFSGIEIIWDRQFGFLKETMVAPVSRFTIMLGRTLGGATVATLQGLIVLILSMIIGFRPYSVAHVIYALLIMFIISLLFTAMGTAIASTMQDMQGFQLVMNFLVMPIFFLSGSLFPLQGIPVAMQIATKLDPMTYGIDALRHVLLDMGTFPIHRDILVLLAFTATFLYIGSYLFKKIQI